MSDGKRKPAKPVFFLAVGKGKWLARGYSSPASDFPCYQPTAFCHIRQGALFSGQPLYFYPPTAKPNLPASGAI